MVASIQVRASAGMSVCAVSRFRSRLTVLAHFQRAALRSVIVYTFGVVLSAYTRSNVDSV